MVEMMYRSNIIALIGGGKSPKYESNKLMLWDDHKTKNIREIAYKSDIKSVHIKSDRIAVALETKVYLYNFADLKLLEHIETCPNPIGLCSLNTEGD